MLEISNAMMSHVCRANEFPVRRDTLIFCGVRGAVPANTADQSFAESHKCEYAPIDHIHPRCTLVQWKPTSGVLAVYPGSTVPHRRYIAAAASRGGLGTNQLVTGYFADYRKGRHKAGKPTGHDAFRQMSTGPFRRTTNDLEYGPEDAADLGNPGDNLHAAWCGGVASEDFSSAGCQVVVGFPRCAHRGASPATGPWAQFFAVAEREAQTSFGYVLIDGEEIRRLALSGAAGAERVRFGSEGPRSRRVQEALAARGLYEGAIDGKFGPRSLRALLAFQETEFGSGGDDGVCGPQTAATLGIAWP